MKNTFILFLALVVSAFAASTTPIKNPVFSGTISGITAADVGAQIAGDYAGAQTITDLSGGGPYALTLGPSPFPKYRVTISAATTFTANANRADGITPVAAGDGAIIENVVTGAPRVVTYPTAYRNNAASTSTSVSVSSPRSDFVLKYTGTEYRWYDEEFGVSDLPGKFDGTFDGQGSVIASAALTYRQIYFTGNIKAAYIIGDASGAITLTVKKYTPSGGALGSSTTLGTIALSSASYNSSTGLSWAVTAGDVISVETGGTITTVQRVNWSLAQ